MSGLGWLDEWGGLEI